MAPALHAGKTCFESYGNVSLEVENTNILTDFSHCGPAG